MNVRLKPALRTGRASGGRELMRDRGMMNSPVFASTNR